MARGAGVAELILMGVLVAGSAIRIEPAEKCARQHLALPRFVALGAFDLGVVADQLKFWIFVVVK